MRGATSALGSHFCGTPIQYLVPPRLSGALMGTNSVFPCLFVTWPADLLAGALANAGGSPRRDWIPDPLTASPWALYK